MRIDFQTSIIIPSYNSIKTIQITIEKLLNNKDIDCINEIIVVDSSDDNVTKQYLKTIDNNKVKIITSGIKVIPGKQRNIGAEAAIGELLIFLDADAYPTENWIKNIISAYSVGWMAGGGAYLIPEFQKNNKVAYAQYYFEFGSYLPHGKNHITKIMPSCNMFCDKNLFLCIGGFPDLRAAEDSLFCLKAGLHVNLIFMPDTCVYHIFRENFNEFLDNQFTLGKFNFVFHRNYHNMFFLKNNLFYILIPFFVSYKFLLRFFYIIKSDYSELRPFFSSFKYFCLATLSWSKGFISGKNLPVNKIIANQRTYYESLHITI